MTGLTAINLLLVPDETTRAQAMALNAALRRDLRSRDLESDFAFDATHQPHITVLHRYVMSADLERVLAAAGNAAAEIDLDDLALRSTGLVAGEFGTPPGTVLVSIDVAPTPGLRALQERLVEAVAPFSASQGTASAFFTTADEPEVGSATIAYVEQFVPAHTGRRYAPHLTVGVGEQRFAEGLKARFEGCPFSAGALAAYQLGNLGTARRALMSWPRASLAA
jgi:2'-5' RNA ligase